MESTSDMFEPVSASKKAMDRQARKVAKESKLPSVLKARSPKQAALIKALDEFAVVFAVGSAGSGKTYVPSRHALQRLRSKAIDRIVLARPTTAPARHRQGYLPGTDEQKMKPWLIPFFDAFRDGAMPAELEKYQHEKRIENMPFERMRGRTISNAVCILDEAQNCTFEDLELFITRIGENAQFVICGDVDQDKDLGGELSGLSTMIDIALKYNLNAGVVVFDENDVVRSKSAAEWVSAIKKHKATKGIPFLAQAA